MDITRFYTKYYIFNALVILSYIPLRCFVSSPALLVHDPLLGVPREAEIVLLLGVILFRKYGKAVTADAFVSTCFLFGKTGVAVLLYLLNWRLMCWYLILYAALFFGVKRPRYSGPSNVTTFNEATFASEVEKGSGAACTWLVALDAAWSDACLNFEATFADVSLRYGTNALRFGRVDVDACPELAARLRVDCSARSWQLPTFILFERRKEAKRLPPFDANGEVVKVSIDREGLCACFELDRRMARSSAVDTGNPKKKRGKKKSL